MKPFLIEWIFLFLLAIPNQSANKKKKVNLSEWMKFLPPEEVKRNWTDTQPH